MNRDCNGRTIKQYEVHEDIRYGTKVFIKNTSGDTKIEVTYRVESSTPNSGRTSQEKTIRLNPGQRKHIGNTKRSAHPYGQNSSYEIVGCIVL